MLCMEICGLKKNYITATTSYSVQPSVIGIRFPSTAVPLTVREETPFSLCSGFLKVMLYHAPRKYLRILNSSISDGIHGFKVSPS